MLSRDSTRIPIHLSTIFIPYSAWFTTRFQFLNLIIGYHPCLLYKPLVVGFTVDSPHKATRKYFHLMTSSWLLLPPLRQRPGLCFYSCWLAYLYVYNVTENIWMYFDGILSIALTWYRRYSLFAFSYIVFQTPQSRHGFGICSRTAFVIEIKNVNIVNTESSNVS